MIDVNNWLTEFIRHWRNKDIESVMDLFTDDVEYWESPFIKVSDKQGLRMEWKAIHKQDDINVSCEVFSSINNKSSVIWNLTYVDGENREQHYRGIYLVVLDDKGKCKYFYHCCESKS